MTNTYYTTSPKPLMPDWCWLALLLSLALALFFR